MLKFVVSHADGRQGLFLGLSRDNLERLPNDMPIVVKTAELDPRRGPDAGAPVFDEIVIFGGETEESMVESLKKAGMKLPAPFDQ